MSVEDMNPEVERLSEVKRCRASTASAKPVFCSYVEISL